MAAAVLFAPLAAFAVEVDGVAARVGTAVILKSDVVHELMRTGLDESRYGEVRNEMIERELILAAAADSKMTMQEWVVEDRIRKIIDNSFGGDRNRLIATLAGQKVSYPEWRKRMRDDMVVAAMRWQTVDRNVNPSPAAMREEYERNSKSYFRDSRVTVTAILLGPDDAGKKKEVEAALKRESFSEVAKRYSADARAKDGGQWKDVKPEDVFRPEICAEIAKMPVGTISRWVELDGWNFLLRKDAESGGEKMSFAEAYDDIAAAIRKAESKRLYDAWIERLKRETYIKVY
jgi:parvulin-like peptidyl-prolyl isomerase